MEPQYFLVTKQHSAGRLQAVYLLRTGISQQLWGGMHMLQGPSWISLLVTTAGYCISLSFLTPQTSAHTHVSCGRPGNTAGLYATFWTKIHFPPLLARPPQSPAPSSPANADWHFTGSGHQTLPRH